MWSCVLFLAFGVKQSCSRHQVIGVIEYGLPTIAFAGGIWHNWIFTKNNFIHSISSSLSKTPDFKHDLPDMVTHAIT